MMEQNHQGTQVSAINHIRLSSMVADGKAEYYKQTAGHLLAVFETRLEDQSIAVPLICCAADMLSVPSRKQVVLVGDKNSSEFGDMVTSVYTSYDPNRTIIQIDPSNKDDTEFWENSNQNTAHMAKGILTNKVVAAHVCQDFVCSAPVADPDALRSLLNKTPASASSSG